jgi:hypothetical protein
MKRAIQWTALVVVVLAAGGSLAFRYYRLLHDTLHDTTPPDVFIRAEAAPPLADISDPAERALAERGRYIVDISACDGCHHTPDPQGSLPGMYMAGGGKYLLADETTVVTSNLTPDATTGLGHVPDEDVLRVLRSGVARNGRTLFHRAMPWTAYSHWTEEDRRAVLTYLRHLPPVPHRIPDPLESAAFMGTGALEEIYFGKDYGAAATP